MGIIKRKILLAAINARWTHPSLALRLLKANLGPFEGRCEIAEFYLRQNLEEKIDAIVSARPFILGLSVSIWNHKASLELLKALKENPVWQIPHIVLGGPEVSFLDEGAEIFRYADYVIRGEGEFAFRKLCEKLFNERNDFENEKCGQPVLIDCTKTELDVGRISPAYRLYTGEDLRHKLTYVESSRGCPFSCEFCQSAFGSSGLREFPLEPFLEEMGDLVERGAKVFKFLDRSFNLNIKRSLAIMEFFLERINRPINGPSNGTSGPLCVHFEMVPGNFPPELMDMIKRFPPGSLRLEIGIQTLNPRTASLIGRTAGMDSALENIAFLMKETSAIVHADLIAGLPGEDLLSFGEGFDRLWACLGQKNSASSMEIQPGILKLLPGAPIARHSKIYGMCYDAQAPYEVLETSAMPPAEMNAVKNFARFWEIIVNRSNYVSFEKNFFPGGKPVFGPFMKLSEKLFNHFGRNWGIDKKELEAFLNGP